MRADAVRRRQALIEAARTLVARRGPDVALDQVAEGAGVGIATLYRNFASRRELIEALAHTLLGELRESIRVATAQFDQDPEAAWATCIHELLALQVGALTPALTEFSGGALAQSVLDEQAQALVELNAFVALAHEAGTLRRDVRAIDLIVMIGLTSRPLPPNLVEQVPTIAERAESVLLAGLRPQD